MTIIILSRKIIANVFISRVFCLYSETRQCEGRRYPISVRSATRRRWHLLPAKPLEAGSGSRRGGSCLLHQLCENWQPQRAAQDRISGLRNSQGENKISQSHLGAIRDQHSAIATVLYDRYTTYIYMESFVIQY